MKEFLYDCCPRCKGVLTFRPISQIYDEDGSKFGFMLACKTCGWYSVDKFYDKSNVQKLYKDKGQNLLEDH